MPIESENQKLLVKHTQFWIGDQFDAEKLIFYNLYSSSEYCEWELFIWLASDVFDDSSLS